MKPNPGARAGLTIGIARRQTSSGSVQWNRATSIVQAKGVGVSLLSPFDLNPGLFKRTLEKLTTAGKISESHSAMESGWTIDAGDDVYVLGHSDGKYIEGQTGEWLAKYLIGKGLKNQACRVVLVSCQAGMAFVDDFNGALLKGFAASTLKVTVLSSQENVNSDVKGSKTGTGVESLSGAAALNAVFAQTQVAEEKKEVKKDPFAGLVTF